MSGPLSGVKVLDLTSVLLGPYATQIMGDLGADVIKIESPAGDTTRQTGVGRNPGMASFFMIANRNKRSLMLDLKRPAAQKALWRLVDTADVFVHAIRPQAIRRLGFGPEAVCERNPRIVYAGSTGSAKMARTATAPPMTTSSRPAAVFRPSCSASRGGQCTRQW
jgi:crotonobetainyl-CoA:carnitine CoA-transferase CaiB-like acyl-CoA transferase